MRAAADTIWRVPAYLPYLQSPLTDDVVAEAEKAIGYRLPDAFLDLLRIQNGGYIRFSLPEMVHDSIAGIGPNFPSLTGFDLEASQEYVSFPLRGLAPFDGDGHWHLCLDYRKNPIVPTITYVDIECDSESHIADSFDDYLGMLQMPVDNKYVMEGISDIETLKVNLSRQLGVPFDPTDSWAHGYPTEHARLGSDEDHQSLWISPNTVRRGFVRPDDQRYSELKDLLPGSADRYPGLPWGSYILSTTGGVQDRVLEACARCGIAVEPLRDFVAGF